MTVVQLDKEFPAFHVKRRFIAVNLEPATGSYPEANESRTQHRRCLGRFQV